MSKVFKFWVHESLRNQCYAGLWTLWNYVHNVIHSFLKFSENLCPRTMWFVSLQFNNDIFVWKTFGRHFLSSTSWPGIKVKIISPSEWGISDHVSVSHRLFFPPLLSVCFMVVFWTFLNSLKIWKARSAELETLYEWSFSEERGSAAYDVRGLGAIEAWLLR